MPHALNKTQELELLSALDSRAESPAKFMYLGDGYQKWINFAENSRAKYAVQFQENVLKVDSLPFIFRNSHKTHKVNIIDLGCGDGVPMLPIFEYLKDFQNVRYIPLDISQDMLEAAKSTVSQQFPDVEVLPILFDFEKGETLEQLLLLSKAENTSNFFFLLGNTLGNFDNTEKILTNIKLLMFSNDVLIIGNEISNLLASPKLVEYYKDPAVFDLAVTTLLAYGMDCSYNEFDVRWNSNQKQIEVFLRMDKDKQITVSNETVSFEKDEEIMLVISKKFAEDALVSLLNKVGFRIDFFTSNKKKNTCIVSVSPTRYKS